MFYNRTLKEFNMPVRNHLERSFYGYAWGQNRHNTIDIPCADVLELDDQFILELALPGVVLDDIELKVENNYLTVIAKRTPTMFEERATYLRKELPATYMVREFEFDTEILIENIEARLDRGLLYVSIPKVEVALRVPVSAGSIEGHVAGKGRSHKTEVRSAKELTIK